LSYLGNKTSIRIIICQKINMQKIAVYNNRGLKLKGQSVITTVLAGNSNNTLNVSYGI